VTQPAPLVANAADPRQVKHARNREKRIVEQRVDQMHAVLQTVAGRAVLWRLLGDLGYGLNLATLPPDRIAIVAGTQAGMWNLLASIVEADEDALIKMMREARAAQKDEAMVAEAVRTPGAGEEIDE
jgi:delta 1-pyrroline-5-carboxylate dehydrogenase